MLVVVLGQKHRRSDEDGLPPKLRQQFALQLDVLHPARVGRHLDRRNNVVGFEVHIVSGSRIEMDLLYVAVEVAGRAIELLSLPLIHVRPDGVPVGAMEFGVDIYQRLYVIVAGGNFAQALEGVAEGIGIDHRGAAWREIGDVSPKERSFLLPGSNVFEQITALVAAQDDEDAAGDRCSMGANGNRRFQTEGPARRGRPPSKRRIEMPERCCEELAFQVFDSGFR